MQIDVSSDTVCPWCFVGKKNLERAMEQTMDKYNFEVRWHPFFLNPDAPKEGVRKSDFYKMKFGPVQFERATSRMTEIFRGLGFEFDISGLTGNTMDSHRLITLAGHQGYDKQNALVEELFQSYFCQGKYIGDKQVLLDVARKVGIEGAEELLEDPSRGVDEVSSTLSRELCPLPYPFDDRAHISFLLPKGSGRTQQVLICHFWGPSLCDQWKISTQWWPASKYIHEGV